LPLPPLREKRGQSEVYLFAVKGGKKKKRGKISKNPCGGAGKSLRNDS